MKEFLYGAAGKGRGPLYKPKGAGHRPPRGKRVYNKPGDSLLDAFGNWLNKKDDKGAEWFYEKALEMMPDLTGKESNEIGAILAAFRDHNNIYAAGIFLSAAYNLMDTDDIVFEDRSGIDIQLLGYKLGKGKRLIIASDSGFRVGEKSEGTILNYGKCDRFGYGSSGTIINYGNTSLFGWMSSGVIINFGETSSMGDGSWGLIINHGDARKIGNDTRPKKTGCVIAATDPDEYFGAPHILTNEAECKKIPGLLEHLGDLRTRVSPYKKVEGKEDEFDPKPYAEIFSSLDGLDIGTDIKRILTEAGRLKDAD